MDWIVKDEKSGRPILIDSHEFRIRYNFSLGWLENYYIGLDKGIIYGSKCDKCGSKYYPPREKCVKCGLETNLFELPKEGILITYTEINVKPQTFSDKEDYIVGVAELEGLKIVGYIEARFEDLKPGKKVLVKVKREGGSPKIFIIPIK